MVISVSGLPGPNVQKHVETEFSLEIVLAIIQSRLMVVLNVVVKKCNPSTVNYKNAVSIYDNI